MKIVPLSTDPAELAETTKGLWNTMSHFFMGLMSDSHRDFSRDTLEDNICLAYSLLSNLQRLLTGVQKITGTQLEHIIHQAIVWNDSKSTKAFYEATLSGENPVVSRKPHGYLFSDYYSQLVYYRNSHIRMRIDLESSLHGTPVHQQLIFNPVFDDLKRRIEVSTRKVTPKRMSKKRAGDTPSNFDDIQTDVLQRYFLLRDIQHLLTGITSYGGNKEDGLFKELVKQVFSDHRRPFYKIPASEKGSKLTPWATTIITSQGSIGGSTEFASDSPATFFPCFEDHVLATQQAA